MRGRSGSRASVWLATFLAAAAVTACHDDAPPPPAVAATTPQTEPPYTLQAGDELEFKFYYTPQMNEREFIYSSGEVTLPLLPNMHAAGLTVPQLHDLLVKTYVEKGILKDPDIEVLLRTTSTNRVFVGGEVGVQGAVPLLGPTTVSRAIVLAQGVKPTAYESQVLLIRQKPDGGQSVVEVNYGRIMKGKDAGDDVLLRSGDVVYVPQSPIAKVGEFVTNLKAALPASLGFGLDYQLNPTGGTVTSSAP